MKVQFLCDMVLCAGQIVSDVLKDRIASVFIFQWSKKNTHLARCVLYRCGQRTDSKGGGPMGVEVICASPSAYCVHFHWFATHSILSPSAPVNAP